MQWHPIETFEPGYLRVGLAEGGEADSLRPADDPNALLLGATHQMPGLLFGAALHWRVTHVLDTP